MADKTPSQNDAGNEPDQSTEPDEAAFWDKFNTAVETVVDKVLDKRIAAERKTRGNTNRNGGRRTLPDILADAIWPQK